MTSVNGFNPVFAGGRDLKIDPIVLNPAGQNEEPDAETEAVYVGLGWNNKTHGSGTPQEGDYKINTDGSISVLHDGAWVQSKHKHIRDIEASAYVKDRGYWDSQGDARKHYLFGSGGGW